MRTRFVESKNHVHFAVESPATSFLIRCLRVTETDGNIVEVHFEISRGLRNFLEIDGYACGRNTCQDRTTSGAKHILLDITKLQKHKVGYFRVNVANFQTNYSLLAEVPIVAGRTGHGGIRQRAFLGSTLQPAGAWEHWQRGARKER